jgi:hypothetical protein
VRGWKRQRERLVAVDRRLELIFLGHAQTR